MRLAPQLACWSATSCSWMVPDWRVTVAPHRSARDRTPSGLPRGTRIEVPARKYSRKLISLARSGVAVIEEMIRSNLLARSADISSSKPVLTKVKRTPAAAQPVPPRPPGHPDAPQRRESAGAVRRRAGAALERAGAPAPGDPGRLGRDRGLQPGRVMPMADV